VYALEQETGCDGFSALLWRKLAARHARGRRQALRYIRDHALHPELFEYETRFRREWLAPGVVEAMEAWEGGKASGGVGDDGKGAAVGSAAVGGAAANRPAENSAAVNGHGAAMNGAAMNGAAVSGAAVNGAAVNGLAVNGAAVNGAAVNGHGAAMNGPAVKGAAATVRDAAVRSLVTEVSPGIFTFDLLSPSFCELLISELEQYESSGMPSMRPNSMNNHGLVLNGPIGLERLMDSLQAAVVAPIAAALFGSEGQSLDHHHAFVVQYKPSEDKGLDMHTDACDVTLNVCLGRDFTGGGLTLCGLRGGDAGPSGGERKLRMVHSHRRGQAILHLGRQRHGADDIVTGERYNLILWNKSSGHRLSRGFLSKYKTRPTADEASPDLVCLSYTHDDDFQNYKPCPLGRKPPAQAGG
jgi:hypothetical protein